MSTVQIPSANAAYKSVGMTPIPMGSMWNLRAMPYICEKPTVFSRPCFIRSEVTAIRRSARRPESELAGIDLSNKTFLSMLTSLKANCGNVVQAAITLSLMDGQIVAVAHDHR